MADREFVLPAVKLYGLALEYAEESLRGDREIVLTAVKSDGLALQNAYKKNAYKSSDKDSEIDFKKFNLVELEQISLSLAILIVDDFASSSYQSIFDNLEITIPNEKDWDFHDDEEGEFFNKCRDLLTDILAKRITVACYTDPNSVSNYLDGNSQEAWEEAVLNADRNANVEAVSYTHLRAHET